MSQNSEKLNVPSFMPFYNYMRKEMSKVIVHSFNAAWKMVHNILRSNTISYYIIQLSSPGRLPDTGVPVLQNPSALMDFAMDPFNNHRIAAGKPQS